MFAGLEILFGFIVCSLLALLFIYVCSIKYLQGDFLKQRVDIEEGGEPWESASGPSSPYKGFSLKGARGEIQQSGFEGGLFAARAVVSISLRYFEENRRIVGVIKSVEHWNRKAPDAPKQIKFLARISPKKKHSTMTNTKSTKKDILALSFMLGPLIYEEMLNATVCFQLLGKQKGLKQKWRCYGECYVYLNDIVGKLDAVEFKKNIMPKAKFIKSDKNSLSGV